MPPKLTNDQIINKFIEKHGDIKFNYKCVNYKNINTEVKIICEIHGEINIKPSNFLYNKYGCPSCDPTIRLGTKKFIEKSNIIHNNLYDYSKSIYGKTNQDYLIIICNDHGEFTQQAGAHLKGQGCPKCSNNKKKTNQEFIKEAISIHGDLYNYNLIEYKTKEDYIKIICNDHGIFEQKAKVHLWGHGCQICNNSKMELYCRNIFKLNNIKFEQNKKFKTCKNKRLLPFDFYLNDYNILIECDGIQHRKVIDFFGGIEKYNYQINNDNIKTQWSIDNNIKLYRLNNLKDIDLFINQTLNL